MSLEALQANVTADISDFESKFASMRKTLDGIEANTRGFGGLEKSAGQAGDALGQVHSKLDGIQTLMRGAVLIEMGEKITNAVTVPILNLGKEMVLAADKFRQAEIAFTTMLGSAEKATAFLGDLRQFAVSTPFEFPDLIQASKKMLALGFAADEILPKMKVIGDAVSGLGGNAQVFDRIVLALGQMKAKGTVSAEEMKQLAEAGIPAWQALADKIGVTVPEAMEMAKKKQIDSATAIAAIQQDMAQRFGGLMEEQAKTIQGRLSNLKDTVGFIMADLGKEVTTALNLEGALGAVEHFARGFIDWFKSLDQGTKQVAIVLTTTFAVGGPILVVVGAFITALTAISAPILIGGAVVAGIVAGAALILLNWQKIKDTGIAVWTATRDAVVGTAEKIYTGIKTWLIDKAEAIASKLQAVAQSFAKPFEWLANHLVGHSVIPDMVEDIGVWMGLLPQQMEPPATQAAQKVADSMSGLRVAVATSGAGIRQEVLTIAEVTGTTFASMAVLIGQTMQTGMANVLTAFVTGKSNISQVLVGLMDNVINILFQTALSVMGIGQLISQALQAMWIPGVGFFVIAGLIAALVAVRASMSRNLTGLAAGGIVTGPTIAQIGEAGDEAVLPLSGRRGRQVLSELSGGGRGGEQRIVLQVDGRTLAEVLLPAMQQRLARKGVV